MRVLKIMFVFTIVAALAFLFVFEECVSSENDGAESGASENKPDKESVEKEPSEQSAENKSKGPGRTPKETVELLFGEGDNKDSDMSDYVNCFTENAIKKIATALRSSHRDPNADDDISKMTDRELVERSFEVEFSKKIPNLPSLNVIEKELLEYKINDKEVVVKIKIKFKIPESDEVLNYEHAMKLVKKEDLWYIEEFMYEGPTDGPGFDTKDKEKRLTELVELARKHFEQGDGNGYKKSLGYAYEALKINPDSEEAKKLSSDILDKLSFTNSIGMKFVPIPAGEFMMGSNNGMNDEKPIHKVNITNVFYMQTTEVTQAQWQAVMGNNPSRFKGDNLPIEKVSWDDAQEFIKKLNEKEKETGRTYRLPTEAEWEYACRAGTTTSFYFGETISTDQVNYDPYDYPPKGQYREKTTPVGSFPPNKWGLYDMHGNVCEWCEDWYAENYYSQSPVEDPKGPSSGTYRVFRGGCWMDFAERCRSANRGSNFPDFRDVVGFRVVCSSQ